MSLRKELQDRWTTTHDISTRWQAKVDELVNELRDLETAIAALTPAPDFTAEKETAREQLEREPEIPAGFTKWEGGVCPFHMGAHVEVLTRNCGVWPVTIKPEAPLLWEHENHDTDVIAYRSIEDAPVADEAQDQIAEFEVELGEDDASEFISDLTGDPAIEPEAGLHDAEGPRVSRPWSLTTAFRDGYEGRKRIAPDHFVYMEEYDKGARAAGFEAPASEPEAGLHGEPVELVYDVSQLLTGPERMVQAAPDEAPALNADMQDEREQPYRITADVDDKPLTIDFETIHEATECMEELKLRSTANAELSVLHEGENGEQERVTLSSFAEAAPEPDAPVTNPEADFWSRGLASEQKPERKFDPFAMFKREDA